MNTFDVIVALSKNNFNEHECHEIEMYLKKGAEWDLLIGQLMLHKLLCRAYNHFIVQNWGGFMPYSIKRPIQRHFELNSYKNKLGKKDFENLLVTLNREKIIYCIMKGLPLEKELFADSIREFNDTDLLVHIRDFELVDKILTQLGYKRGVYNTKLNKIESNRHMDIHHIMNTHQTVPYRKLTNDMFFKVDTIDLQFEFTLQKKFNYSIDIDLLLNDRVCIDIYEKDCYTLNTFDNFILLCTHLYGEAVLIQEIKKYKDMQLTKFADVYEWIEKYYQLFDWEEKIKSITARGLLRPVLYCVYILSNLYHSSGSKHIYEKMGKQDLRFVDEYKDECFNDKMWKLPVIDRIFRIDKLDML